MNNPPRLELQEFKSEKRLKQIGRFSRNSTTGQTYRIGVPINLHETKCHKDFITKDRDKYQGRVHYTHLGWNHQSRSKCTQCGKELDTKLAKEARKAIKEHFKASKEWQSHFDEWKEAKKQDKLNQERLAELDEANKLLEALLD